MKARAGLQVRISDNLTPSKNYANFIIILPENISPGHAIFFLGIIAVQNIVNICFFIITAIHCNRIKTEIHRMQMTDNSEQKKKRFISDRAK